MSGERVEIMWIAPEIISIKASSGYHCKFLVLGGQTVLLKDLVTPLILSGGHVTLSNVEVRDGDCVLEDKYIIVTWVGKGKIKNWITSTDTHPHYICTELKRVGSWEKGKGQ
jgi:hypothetical protein